MKGISSLFSRLTLSSPTAAANAARGDTKDKKKTTGTTSEKYGSLSANVRPGTNKEGVNLFSHSVAPEPSRTDKPCATTFPRQGRSQQSSGPALLELSNDVDADDTSSVWETVSSSISSSLTVPSLGAVPPALLIDTTTKPRWVIESLERELREHGRTPEQVLLRKLRGMCYDVVADNIMRHSIAKIEAISTSRFHFTPEERTEAFALLVKQGHIRIDKEHPNYIFLPVPPEIIAMDAKPRSVSASSSNLKSSLVKSQSNMPDFFAKMGPAERRFYERDAAAVLLHYITEASEYIPLSTKKTVEKNVLCFTIPRAMVDEAARDQDPGIGIHPYLIPKAVELLMQTELYAPRSANDQDFHFKGTCPQFGRTMQNFSHTYQF